MSLANGIVPDHFNGNRHFDFRDEVLAPRTM